MHVCILRAESCMHVGGAHRRRPAKREDVAQDMLQIVIAVINDPALPFILAVTVHRPEQYRSLSRANL